VPTQQLTDAEARNELRRSQAGIVKESDVRIPVRDGSYLLADVFRPSAPGRYPVLLRLSVYGRTFGMGSIVTEEDRLAAEVREDEWFTQPRDALPGLTRLAENAVSANTFDWVPRGYVCVRVDSRGVGRTPGTLAPFSPQEALDYYDAIEWAAAQDWSDGNVGLYGSSYTGTNQWNVANLRPPSLKAIMPWAADGDAYRELAYPGGILAEAYRRNWWTMVTSASPGSSHSDFYTFEPTDRDLDVIGHPRAALWVSSTSHDMDVFVALRVIKPDGTELRYAHDPREPMASGSLKVSHRRTDPERSSAGPGTRTAARTSSRCSPGRWWRSRSRSWAPRPGCPQAAACAWTSTRSSATATPWAAAPAASSAPTTAATTTGPATGSTPAPASPAGWTSRSCPPPGSPGRRLVPLSSDSVSSFPGPRPGRRLCNTSYPAS
jgi:predicted acyl esterase